MSEYSDVVRTAQEYYNSDDAETFYATVWGGEDLHIGLYKDDQEDIRTASERTVAEIADKVEGLDDTTRVIDLGGGYGGSARFLARKYGCPVVSLNLSEVQNERGRRINREVGLDHLVTIVDGDFENVPFDDDSFDLVWSQDSFLHSGDRPAVLREIKRVLKPGGQLIFTDPMEAGGCDREVLQPVLDRLQLATLGSPAFYEEELQKLGFEKIDFHDYSHQLPRHYQRVKDELQERYDELLGSISKEYLDNMIAGLGHWVRNGEAGNLRWGIFHFRLPG